MRGKNWHFGVKASIGAEASSVGMHAVVNTAAELADITVGHGLPHGSEQRVLVDPACCGAEKRPGASWRRAQRHAAIKL